MKRQFKKECSSSFSSTSLVIYWETVNWKSENLRSKTNYYFSIDCNCFFICVVMLLQALQHFLYLNFHINIVCTTMFCLSSHIPDSKEFSFLLFVNIYQSHMHGSFLLRNWNFHFHYHWHCSTISILKEASNEMLLQYIGKGSFHFWFPISDMKQLRVHRPNWNICLLVT